MEFKVIVTVIFMLLSLILVSRALSRAGYPSEKTLDEIVKNAGNGIEGYIFLTPPEAFNICEYVDGGPGCGDESIGVEGGCILEKNVRHIIRAYPVGDNVCLNVTVMGSG
jgi:hypothetical protein